MRTHFNLAPEEYERTRDGHQARRRLDLVEHCLATAGDVRRVLEVGCGTGLLLGRLAAGRPEVEFVGTDLEQSMIDYASTRHRLPNVQFLVADVTAGALDGTFDVVFSVDLVHHLKDHAAGFRAIRSVLRSGSRWLIVEPNIYNLYIAFSQERMKRAGYDEDHFRPWRLRSVMEACGFRVLDRRFALVVPSGVQKVPPWLAAAERRLERLPFVGGAACWTLVAVE